MTLQGLLANLSRRRQTRVEATRSEFENLAAAVATGKKLPAPEEVEAILERTAKTPDDLEAAVGKYLRRSELAALVSQEPQLIAEQRAIETRRAAIGAELHEHRRRAFEENERLNTRLNEIGAKLSAITLAGSELVATERHAGEIYRVVRAAQNDRVREQELERELRYEEGAAAALRRDKQTKNPRDVPPNIEEMIAHRDRRAGNKRRELTEVRARLQGAKDRTEQLSAGQFRP